MNVKSKIEVFGRFHVRISKNFFFGFAEHQEKAKFEFGHECNIKKKF